MPHNPIMRISSDGFIRKLISTETIFHDGGKAKEPLLKGSVCGLLENPYAGGYLEEITPFMEDVLPALGQELARDLLGALGVDVSRIEGFGKGAIVGSAGELEHAALWHAPGGYAMREFLGDAKAIVPSTKKVGAPGARLDVPISHINASYVRSHLDAIEVGMPGAPTAKQMLVVLAMSTGPRIHSRSGGLQADEIEGEDGLR